MNNQDAVIIMSQEGTLEVWISDQAKKNISFSPNVKELQELYGGQLRFINEAGGTKIECPYRKTVPPFTPQSLRVNLKKFLGLRAIVQNFRMR